jgi:hypothetical protein
MSGAIFAPPGNSDICVGFKSQNYADVAESRPVNIVFFAPVRVRPPFKQF